LVGFVLGNLLFCFGEVRVGQSFVLFWWGSCWAILFCGCPLCIRPTRSLTQLSVGRYIILIPRQQTFAITPYCVVSFNMGWQDNRKCYPALPLGMKY
jgi:hypothetical protein